MKKVWIIGCSSGIGLELVKCYLQKQYHVVASSRNAITSDSLLELKNKYEKTLNMINVDVEDNKSVKEATQFAYEHLKSIDICIFNAGVYEVMKYKKWKMKHFESMTNINYLGAVRIINALVPYFESQGFGRCVFNASLSSYFGLPYGGGYSASKAALVNFAQSIQPELAIKNIQIQIINHGFVNTRLTAKNDFNMPELMTARFAARSIFTGLQESNGFEVKFPFKLSLFLQLLNILPYSISLAITKRLLK